MNPIKSTKILMLAVIALLGAACYEVEFRDTNESTHDPILEFQRECGDSYAVPVPPNAILVLPSLNNEDDYYSRITIEKNGTLTLASAGDSDPRVTLMRYDDCGTIAAHDDISESDKNFSLTREVEPGKYRIKVHFRNVGSFRMDTKFTPAP